MPYIESWNFTMQKELPKGFLAQAGYVGNRQIKQLQVMNVNVGTPGGGTASEPLNQTYGRTGSSGLIENYGGTPTTRCRLSCGRAFPMGLR